MPLSLLVSKGLPFPWLLPEMWLRRELHQKRQGDLSTRLFMINQVTGYETSRDYRRLLELMREQSVICLVDFSRTCRDIAKTFYEYRPQCKTKETFQVQARGVAYIYDWEEKRFLESCKRLNLEFILPTNSPAEKNMQTDPAVPTDLNIYLPQ
jgi:hypothetical protein